ncbi:MAG: hypothetical protein RMM08_02695, partial [Armatimonadota bacterium]|nr:hypothetical protein [Armatimonadota bacterium]
IPDFAFPVSIHEAFVRNGVQYRRLAAFVANTLFVNPHPCHAEGTETSSRFFASPGTTEERWHPLQS